MPGAPVPPEIAHLERPRDELLTWYFLKALATVFLFPVTMLMFYFRFHTMRYKFDEEGIHMAWGILMRHEIMLNYSRIQDIQLHSNVIERWLGLTRIEVQTAAGASDSEMTLEGLPDPEAMRDFLYSRMRGAHTATPGAANAVSEPLEAVLLEVASELRAIREILEARRA
ncbi:MAG TPA: PH domain-containing protein [Bryobacteraceae bacterium]|jgi:putative membrane protein